MLHPLERLLVEASNLAGGNSCADGHDWVTFGGRRCPHIDERTDVAPCGQDMASQPAYQCARCPAVDYGEPGGPGWQDCQDCLAAAGALA